MHYKYLIVGGGMTADAAACSIRSIDHDNNICIITSEEYPPYKRPPLSKKLWQNKPLESIWLNTADQNVDIVTNVTVSRIDSNNHIAYDKAGNEYAYEKLLLATGGTPRKLPFNTEDIIYFRTLDDYHRLRKLAENGQHFVVIGGGFIGTEIASALTEFGKMVTMIFPEPEICYRIFPLELANYITTYYTSQGVQVLSGDNVMQIEPDGGRYAVKTANGITVHADAVVAGIGITPNTSLATETGIDVNNGIKTSSGLQTNIPDIYAAGDCASFVSQITGEITRVEHEDNAISMGRTVGLSMAGESVEYRHIPMFYSDMFDMGYEAAGETDSRMDVVIDWQEIFKSGVLYYLKGRKLHGIVLWNVWDRIDDARRILMEQKEYTHGDLVGCIEF